MGGPDPDLADLVPAHRIGADPPGDAPPARLETTGATSPARAGAALAIVCLAAYTATSYGGLRSPDAEVMYRTAESLATAGTFAVESGPQGWPGFGLARGTDGRRYSVFGPLLPIVLVPAVKLAIALEPTRWYERLAEVPPSHHVAGGWRAAMRGAPVTDLAPHARRLIASFTNVVLGVLAVVVFWRVARRLCPDEHASLVAALAFALATPAWCYAGTLLSEPLSTLLVLLSVWGLLLGGPRAMLASGLALGLAAAAHVTAFLFAPFLAWCVFARSRERRWTATAAFAIGVAGVVAALAAFNLARFGSVFETGRAVDPADIVRYGYGTWVAPWRGLYGLLLSPGKGMLFYVPLVVLGAFAWRALRREDPALATAIAAAVVFRIVFVASRSDWDGGFSVGPRLLVQAVPLMLLPIAPWLASVRAPARGWATAAIAVLSLQQAYLAMGEPFRYLHGARMRLAVTSSGGPEADFAFFTGMSSSPLWHLPQAGLGAWLPRSLGLSFWSAVAVAAVLLIVGFSAVAVGWRRARPGEAAALAGPSAGP